MWILYNPILSRANMTVTGFTTIPLFYFQFKVLDRIAHSQRTGREFHVMLPLNAKNLVKIT